MDNALGLINIPALLAKSTGTDAIAVGVIDGPVSLNHEAFETSKIRTARGSDFAACKTSDSAACMHGTFVTGILTGKRGPNAPALCPGCEIILRPIFSEESHGQEFELPSSTPDELAEAIIDCIHTGANIINLSIGLSTTSVIRLPRLEEAYAYAAQKGVPIVVAAGNQGKMGFPIPGNPWVIPVVACNSEGKPDPSSDISPTIAKNGLMAPGTNITSVSAGGGFKQLSGTSFAAPFVSGTMALLWSMFRNATPQEIVLSIRAVTTNRYAKIFPPLCDAEKSRIILEALINSRC
jgi:subtilisin family serine protease